MRKSLTACDALAALPPTPRMNSRPPAARHSARVAATRSIAATSSCLRISPASARNCSRKRHDLRNSAEIVDALHGADLVEPLGRLPRGQFAATQQILVNRGQVVGLAGRHIVEGAALESAQPVIDVAHGRRAVRLVVGQNPAAGELHVAGVPPTLRCDTRSSGRACRHRRNAASGRPRSRRAGRNRRRARRTRRPAAAARGEARRPCRASRGPSNEYSTCSPKARAVAGERLDHLAQVAHAQHHALDAVAPQQPQLVREERLARRPRSAPWESSR